MHPNKPSPDNPRWPKPATQSSSTSRWGQRLTDAVKAGLVTLAACGLVALVTGGTQAQAQTPSWRQAYQSPASTTSVATDTSPEVAASPSTPSQASQGTSRFQSAPMVDASASSSAKAARALAARKRALQDAAALAPADPKRVEAPSSPTQKLGAPSMMDRFSSHPKFEPNPMIPQAPITEATATDLKRIKTQADHGITGFLLTGKHTEVKCEECHSNSVFRGTPRTCAGCHTSGLGARKGTVSKPPSHLPTTAACDTCHTTKDFSVVRFTHQDVRPGTCASCHNGVTQSGKPVGHLVTSAPCDTCHKPVAWTAVAKFDHVGVAPGTCASCHNGVKATGKIVNHMPTALSCDACHAPSAGWRVNSWSHSQQPVTGLCSTCHNGSVPLAQGKVPGHLNDAALAGITNCDSCHKAGFVTWAGGRLHANATSITTGCATCHNGGAFGATQKPLNATHASITGGCEGCHKSTSAWVGAGGVTYTHSAQNAVGTGTCDGCHANGVGLAKPASHFPITTAQAKCDACHKLQTTFAGTTMNHAAVPTVACATCHTGAFPPALGKIANHIPYASVAAISATTCDTCHKAGGFTTWAGGKMHTSVTVSVSCATCHMNTAIAVTQKPNTATHAAVTGNCESCHKSTAAWMSGVTFTHSAAQAVGTGTCDTCHTGSPGLGKPVNHAPVPVGAKCDACHKLQTTFAGTTMNHAIATGMACATCHSGAYLAATGKIANHVPYASVAAISATTCDVCHKAGGYTTWAGGKVHTSATVTASCATCHMNAAIAVTQKPNTATHATVTGNCEGCHKSTTSWTSGVAYTHSALNAVGSGTCDTCHTGSPGLGKPAAHIPVVSTTAKCDACHKSQVSFAGAAMSHTAVSTMACKTCHNGSYTTQGTLGAQAKPSNHIPEATGLLNGSTMDCQACHTAAGVSFLTEKMNHNGTQGNGSGSCKTCHATGTSFLGSMQKKAVNHQGAPATGDCSMSGCHKPLGGKGTVYVSWK